jgi:hypothetical protein
MWNDMMATVFSENGNRSLGSLTIPQFLNSPGTTVEMCLRLYADST